MAIAEIQKQTNANIQEKANLIWEIATHLVGFYKPHEYGKVILPMTVLKRFDDALAATKDKVLSTFETLNAQGFDGQIRDGALCRASGYSFYNTSKFNFARLLADPDNIEANFEDYMQGFSDNVKDIMANFKFADEIKNMAKGNVLYVVIQEFNSKKADMSPDKITSTDMGYIFEELIRKFSESYNEEAGAHFTSRDVIYLMTELLVAPEKDEIKANGCYKTAYDMTMGTSQMLGCLTERLIDINPDADLTCFGQEFNPETYAIAKADMMIKGGNASGMKFGDTLSEDAYYGYEFDYIISNPPFGIDWKREKDAVEREARLGYEGRFGPGLPTISDGQMLFMLNGVKKLKNTGRMAIIQNGSPLFCGDAESGPSNIRGYLLENDWLEAIIQLPNDLFYNTGIATYIWVVAKDKEASRRGKVQLIDASKCFIKRRKPLGNKKNDLNENCIKLIIDAFLSCDNATFADGTLVVESKIYDNDHFKYTKVIVEQPMLDAKGSPLRKKGVLVPNPQLRDTDNIPFGTSFDDYLKENILPYAPNAWIDTTKNKTGYEFSFGKYFYKPEQYQSSSEILEEISRIDTRIQLLTNELLTTFKAIGSLDSNKDELIDTGIEWFPKMPKHWKRLKGRYVLELLKRPVLDTDGVITCFRDGEVTLRSNRREEGFTFADKEIGYQGIEVGDLVIHGMDGFAGAIGISDSRGKGSPVLNVCSVKESFDKEYILWYLRYLAYQNVFVATATGIRERSCDLRWSKIANLDFLIPNLDEQKDIVSKISALFTPINELLALKTKQETLYKEFRKAVVAELVGI